MFYTLATRPARNNIALERLLSDAGRSVAADRSASRSATIEDQEKTYSLQLDVPGLAKDQLDIGIEGDVVRISSKEGAARNVKAAWRFPLEVDAGASTARLENGVLTLSLAKKFPVSNVAQLAIE